MSLAEPMRIGVDLDNTILSYTALFHALARERGWIDEACPSGKRAIKATLARVAGSAGEGERRWQKLQALAYGAEIDRAQLFTGFEAFARAARRAGWPLFIVSHKTRVSNLDPTAALRAHALRTLTTRGFFRAADEGGLGFAETDVFFEDTRDAKIAVIARLNLSHFIDDLPAVFERPDFPGGVQPILCHTPETPPTRPLLRLRDWAEIQDYFFHWTPALSRLKVAALKGASPIKEGGNNVIVKLEPASGAPIVLKRHFRDADDPRPRLESEWRFLSHLWARGARNIPEPLAKTEEVLVERFVDGVHPDVDDPADAGQFVEMLATLDRAGDGAADAGVGPAADARLRLADFVDGLNRRWRDIETAAGDDARLAAVGALLRDELAPLGQAARAAFERICRARRLDPERPLDPALRFLSPSDFGPHNAVKDPSGRVVFLDFEYAGWDDPAKLMADFLRHVGYDAPPGPRLAVLRAFAEGRARDPGLWDRFTAVADLVGVEWILIVLNIVAPNLRRRKLRAQPDLTAKALIEQRIRRARLMANQFKPIAELLVECSA